MEKEKELNLVDLLLLCEETKPTDYEKHLQITNALLMLVVKLEQRVSELETKVETK